MVDASQTHENPHAALADRGTPSRPTMSPQQAVSGGIGGGDPRETGLSPAIEPGWMVRGILREVAEQHIVLEVPGTNYRVHLVPTAPIATPVGKRITGRIDAQARRIDICHTGGNYIDPVFGRPRNLQGRVLAQLHSEGTLVIKPVVPMFIRLKVPQVPTMFDEGVLVTFAIEPGATFTPVEG